VPQFKHSESGTYVIASQGTGTGPAGYQITVTPRDSWVGSLVFKQNTAPNGATPVYVNVAYQNANTAEEVTAGTAITSAAAIIISPTAGDLVVVYTHTAGEVLVNVNPATQGVTNSELAVAFTAAGYSTAGQDTPVAMLSAAMKNLLGQSFDVRVFGAVGGSTNDTIAFEACCAAASALGAGRVLIPFDTFTVTGPANASGCALVGNGSTVVSGYFENAATVEGLTIAGIPQDYTAQHPVIPFDGVMKAVRYIDANRFLAFVENVRSGYALLTFRNNVTTTNNSLAVTAADETQFRVTGFQHCVEVLTGYLTASAESGTWTTTTLSTGVPTFDSGSYYNYTRSTTIGAYKDFAITVPEDGFFSVTFLRGTTASNDIDVLVDSVAIDEGINTTIGAGSDRYTKVYRTTPGAHTVRIINQTAGSTGLNIVGLNFAPLKDQRLDVDVDTFGYYRNEASFLAPITENSANDYALRDDVSGLYGGSYHGGETGFTSDLIVDGTEVTLSSGFVLGRTVEWVQSSSIVWPAGPTVTSLTRHVLHRGGYSLATTLTGDITAREYYTVLVGLNENFTGLTYPKELAFSGITNLARPSLGQTQAVEYVSSTTGQRFRITHSTYTQPENRYGGSFVWKVNGTYLKYYAPWIHTGSRLVPSLSAVVVMQAS